jgi:hypothetical protein
MSKSGNGGHRTLPWASTEHGALQASNVLHSPEAIAMSVYVFRAFIRLREVLAENQVMAKRMADVEKDSGDARRHIELYISENQTASSASA